MNNSITASLILVLSLLLFSCVDNKSHVKENNQDFFEDSLLLLVTSDISKPKEINKDSIIISIDNYIIELEKNINSLKLVNEGVFDANGNEEDGAGQHAYFDDNNVIVLRKHYTNDGSTYTYYLEGVIVAKHFVFQNWYGFFLKDYQKKYKKWVSQQVENDINPIDLIQWKEYYYQAILIGIKVKPSFMGISDSFRTIDINKYCSSYSLEISSENLTQYCGQIPVFYFYPADSLVYLNEDYLKYPEICNFKNIKRYSFYGNLVNTIPENCEMLNRVEVIEIKNSNLLNIPQQILNLKKVVEIEASGNKMEVVKTSESYRKLKNLNLSYNKINKIIGVENFVVLRALNLNNNKLNLFPYELGVLPKLEVLNLGSNQIKEINSPINLPNITHLNLSWNNLKYLPSGGNNLNNLISLDVHSNQLDSIPLTILNLKSLRTIVLNGNTGIDVNALRQKYPHLEIK